MSHRYMHKETDLERESDRDLKRRGEEQREPACDVRELQFFGVGFRIDEGCTTQGLDKRDALTPQEPCGPPRFQVIPPPLTAIVSEG